jgi:hypothetical protein
MARSTETAASAGFTRSSPSSTCRRAPHTMINVSLRQTSGVSSPEVGTVKSDPCKTRANESSGAQAKRRFASNATATQVLGKARRTYRGRSRPSNFSTALVVNSRWHIPIRFIRCGSASRLSRCFAARAARTYASSFRSFESSS